MRSYQYFVYILSCKANTAIYVGMTNDLERRVLEHKIKFNKSYSALYNIDRLIYFEKYSMVEKAIAREKQLKNWKRSWKIDLIEKENPNWNDLSEGWYDEIDLHQ